MLVSMGIFNVILGVYVEITMKALIFSCPDRDPSSLWIYHDLSTKRI